MINARTLMIGIDGFDRELIVKFRDSLPNISELVKEGCEVKMESVFPPDSITAWASIYTGMNPAKHGMVHFVDPLEKVSMLMSTKEDNSSIRERTFWDILGLYSKKVCIINPSLAFPVWPVNGMIIARSSKQVQIYPDKLSEKYEIKNLTGISGLPNGRRDFEKFKLDAIKVIRQNAELGLEIMKEERWDLFFIYFSEVDWIEHFFWSSYDEEDPDHIPNDPYANVIKEFYVLLDEVVGKFIHLVDDDTNIILLSDHGHGRRPERIVNINKILKEKYLLTSKIRRSNYTDPIFLFEKMKRYAIRFIANHELGGVAGKLLKLVPSARRIYTSPLSIDWEKTIAYTSDLSGIKSYSYGGLKINKTRLKDSEYENLRDMLIHELSQLEDPDRADELFKWIVRREDLYSGPYLWNYPDIIFLLKYGWGCGWNAEGQLFDMADIHSIVPGSHKIDSPVFIIRTGDKIPVDSNLITLMDIAPTILDLFGIDWRMFDFDGRSILESIK